MKPIVFYDPTFPYEGHPLSKQALDRLHEEFIVTDAVKLGETLEKADDVCFIHLHGPYFPKHAWRAILAHLRKGCGFVHTGGVPFRIPVVVEGEGWRKEREQTAYHQQLNIHEALHVDGTRISSLVHHADIPLLAGSESLFDIQDTYGLVLHATKYDDHPHELGSSGPMDAHISPLLKGISREGRAVAAPAVLIENTKGAFSGGRWVFINQRLTERFWNDEGFRTLVACAAFCGRGVTEFWLKMNYASYEPGEKPILTLQYQFLKGIEETSWQLEWEVVLDGKTICSKHHPIIVSKELGVFKEPLPIHAEPGYYEVICKLVSEHEETRILRQGFWGMDRQLLASGSRLQCSRDYFVKDGKPLPIVGMTYMASDVARKFLFLPNVGVWDRDMKQMKAAGINLVRTGIWTAWRQMAFVDGHTSEEVLRAIDAFILTARKYELEVTFNFFSFTPETWEGRNPYLDPRSVEAQKRFIVSVVSRHRDTTNVHWDLINEPSMFDPKRVFAGPRSSHDPYEHAAYVRWLKERHQDIRVLQERWNMTSEELPDFESVKLPEPSDINFGIQDVTRPKKGLVWVDYCLFSMEMHNRWARELVQTIKSIQPTQLITVGQDEALPSQRPSPFFYAEAVDYTSVHSWWRMDDLVWDGIFTKDPLKPNLIQETGIMYLENADGKARRTEEELRNILERKYAYAFATGGAGAVQWIWNINFYMDNINESNIGALRADGTEKPEADVSYHFGAFIKEIGEEFQDRQLEEIVVVYPYANDFSNRSFAREATTKLTRCLAYEMKLPHRGAGEYQLDRLADQPVKLYIVPSAHTMHDRAVEQLLHTISEHGSTLLITGPVSLDEYWHHNDRMLDILGETKLEHILREEMLDIDGVRSSVSFGGARIADAWKERPADGSRSSAVSVKTVRVGRGTLIWCPLPVELNNRTEAMQAVYRYAVQRAGVSSEMEWLKGGELPGVYGRKLAFAGGSLFVFVSEYACDTEIAVRDPAMGRSYEFLLQQERCVLFFTDSIGEVRAVYRPDEVTVTVKH